MTQRERNCAFKNANHSDNTKFLHMATKQNAGNVWDKSVLGNTAELSCLHAIVWPLRGSSQPPKIRDNTKRIEVLGGVETAGGICLTVPHV
jgi:hypothetical protein